MKCFHSFLRSMLVSGSLIWIPKYPKFKAVSMLWLPCPHPFHAQPSNPCKTQSDITKVQKDEPCSHPKGHIQGFFFRMGVEGWNPWLIKKKTTPCQKLPPPPFILQYQMRFLGARAPLQIARLSLSEWSKSLRNDLTELLDFCKFLF